MPLELSSGAGVRPRLSSTSAVSRSSSSAAPAAVADSAAGPPSADAVVVAAGSGGGRRSSMRSGGSPRINCATVGWISTSWRSTRATRPAASRRGTGRAGSASGPASLVIPTLGPIARAVRTSRGPSSRSSSSSCHWRGVRGAWSVAMCRARQGRAAVVCPAMCSPASSRQTMARSTRVARWALICAAAARPDSALRTAASLTARRARLPRSPSVAARSTSRIAACSRSNSSPTTLIEPADIARCARTFTPPGGGEARSGRAPRRATNSSSGRWESTCANPLGWSVALTGLSVVVGGSLPGACGRMAE